MANFSLNFLDGFLNIKKIDDNSKGFSGPMIEGIEKIVQTDSAMQLFFASQEMLDKCKQQTGWGNNVQDGTNVAAGNSFSLSVPIHTGKTKNNHPIAYIACLYSHSRKYAKYAYYLNWNIIEA